MKIDGTILHGWLLLCALSALSHCGAHATTQGQSAASSHLRCKPVTSKISATSHRERIIPTLPVIYDRRPPFGKAGTMTARIDSAYATARDRYAEAGVDTDAAMARLSNVPISLHCWQGDDVEGFENFGTGLGGGWQPPATIQARRERLTISGRTRRWRCRSSRARTASTCMPRTESSAASPVDRDEIGPEHFAGWIEWAKGLGIGLDFNPTYFSHPKAADNITLSHADAGDPAFLDRPRHRLPAHWRRDGQGPRQSRASRISGFPTA